MAENMAWTQKFDDELLELETSTVPFHELVKECKHRVPGGSIVIEKNLERLSGDSEAIAYCGNSPSGFLSESDITVMADILDPSAVEGECGKLSQYAGTDGIGQ